jgi:hypothetical protein
MSSININSVIIIQSLQHDERKTGDEIVRVVNYGCLRRGYDKFGYLQDIHIKEEFIGFLVNVKEQVSDGLRPIIHFEIHGCQEGFILSSGELVKWEEIADIVRDINIETANNLFVSLATCFGSYFLSIFDFTRPCPFYGYIGPVTEIGELHLEYSFSAFYEKLFDGTIEDAIVSLQKSVPETARLFVFINCYQYYDRLYARHKEIMSDTIQRQQRIDRTIKKYFPFTTLTLTDFKALIENNSSPNIIDEQFAKWKKIFLHQA